MSFSRGENNRMLFAIQFWCTTVRSPSSSFFFFSFFFFVFVVKLQTNTIIPFDMYAVKMTMLIIHHDCHIFTGDDDFSSSHDGPVKWKLFFCKKRKPNNTSGAQVVVILVLKDNLQNSITSLFSLVQNGVISLLITFIMNHRGRGEPSHVSYLLHSEFEDGSLGFSGSQVTGSFQVFQVIFELNSEM